VAGPKRTVPVAGPHTCQENRPLAPVAGPYQPGTCHKNRPHGSPPVAGPWLIHLPREPSPWLVSARLFPPSLTCQENRPRGTPVAHPWHKRTVPVAGPWSLAQHLPREPSPWLAVADLWLIHLPREPSPWLARGWSPMAAPQENRPRGWSPMAAPQENRPRGWSPWLAQTAPMPGAPKRNSRH
jgi:hypothetical protein